MCVSLLLCVALCILHARIYASTCTLTTAHYLCIILPMFLVVPSTSNKVLNHTVSVMYMANLLSIPISMLAGMYHQLHHDSTNRPHFCTRGCVVSIW
jgi:hypothetical protein